VLAPRHLILAGVVLIAVALGSSGHGFWWLFGLFWLLPHAGRHGRVCGRASGRRRGHDRVLPEGGSAPAAEPDPTRDRHEAFPVR
jgi:hypothetical protein